MSKAQNKITGMVGEDLATEYLESIGYRILKRNLSYNFGEIDILAQSKDGTIVIVEVKTVLGSGWGQAQDLVRHKKQQKLRLLASAIEKDFPDRDIRIDVIAVDQGKIKHLENAVEG